MYFWAADNSQTGKYTITDFRVLDMIKNKGEIPKLVIPANKRQMDLLDYVLKYKWVMYILVFLVMLGVNFLFRGGKKREQN